MNLKQLLLTTPETLAVEQHNALKLHVLNKLAEVTKAIRDENYKYVEKLTSHSAAGDGYGNENDFIEFGVDLEESSDILETVTRLIELKAIFSKETTKTKR